MADYLIPLFSKPAGSFDDSYLLVPLFSQTIETADSFVLKPSVLLLTRTMTYHAAGSFVLKPEVGLLFFSHHLF